MRLFALLAAMCAFCQIALAQTRDCRSISDESGRLACYDKAAPPVASKPPPRTAPTPVSKGDGTYVDSISAEDALMNARLKNICKGC
jgi:hypothetical protein